MTAVDTAAAQPSEREAFETWALSDDGGWWPDAITRVGDTYKAGAVAKMWTGWKARATLAEPAVPPEIAAIIERLHTQDNRITESPLFAVQQKRVIGGMGNGYEEGWCWVNTDSEEVHDAEDIARLNARFDDGESEPDGYRRVGYIERWEFVTGCLTEQGCKDFIACNGHNLHEPRIYAYGSYRNAEFIALRKWLMGLRAAAGAGEPTPSCKGSPGECKFNGACMYQCGGEPTEPSAEVQIRFVVGSRIYGSPTATDVLEYANTRLADEGERKCCATDNRLAGFANVRRLLAVAVPAVREPSDEPEAIRLAYKTGYDEGYSDASDGMVDHDAAEEGWQQYRERMEPK